MKICKNNYQNNIIINNYAENKNNLKNKENDSYSLFNKTFTNNFCLDDNRNNNNEYNLKTTEKEDLVKIKKERILSQKKYMVNEPNKFNKIDKTRNNEVFDNNNNNFNQTLSNLGSIQNNKKKVYHLPKSLKNKIINSDNKNPKFFPKKLKNNNSNNRYNEKIKPQKLNFKSDNHKELFFIKDHQKQANKSEANYQLNMKVSKDNEEKINFIPRLRNDKEERETELYAKISNNDNKEKVLNKRITGINKREKELNEKEKKLNKDISEINIREKKLEERKIEFDKREKELNEREKEVKNKIEENDKKEKNLNEREKELNKKKKEIDKREKELNEKLSKFEIEYKEQKNIKEENSSLKNKNKELENILNDLKSKFNKNPLILYTKPTLIGLDNRGATCFMNAILQCLSQTKELTNYFLSETNKTKIINNNIFLKNKNEPQLSPLYYELIQNLWATNKSNAYNPYNFIKKINEMNPLIISGQIDDSKELIIFILDQLHKELKKNLVDNDINVPFNQYNNNTFKNFFKNFKENCSIISDIFFGVNQTINCINNYNSPNLFGPVNYNYEIFICLIFPLDDVRKMKNNSNQNINFNFNQINNNIISIYDCFLFNQKKELFECQNQYNINKVSIYASPNILIIILNRSRGNMYDVKLNYTETIDITEYVLMKEKPRIIYNLYGVISHICQGNQNAHYIASCKSPIDNKWYRYNDSLVTPINNLQSDVLDYGIPYILFYRKH